MNRTRDKSRGETRDKLRGETRDNMTPETTMQILHSLDRCDFHSEVDLIQRTAIE